LLTGWLLGLFDSGGWRWIFFLYSIPGVLWALWFYRWFRDRPEDHPGVNEAELLLIRDGAPPPAADDPQTKPATPWVAILSSGAMWWISTQQFFRAAGYIFFASWFPTYLKKTFGSTTEQAGLLTSLPLIAYVLGSLYGGHLSDRIMRKTGSLRLARQVLAMISLLICGGLILLSYPIDSDFWAVLVISAASFFSAMAGPCAYTITIDMGGKNVPMVFSLMNMAGNIGAVIFPIVVPRLVVWTGSWDPVLFLVAGLYVASALCWAFLNPSGTIGERSAS
jgi:nitrate/nitrite transporter NarK